MLRPQPLLVEMPELEPFEPLEPLDETPPDPLPEKTPLEPEDPFPPSPPVWPVPVTEAHPTRGTAASMAIIDQHDPRRLPKFISPSVFDQYHFPMQRRCRSALASRRWRGAAHDPLTRVVMSEGGGARRPADQDHGAHRIAHGVSPAAFPSTPAALSVLLSGEMPGPKVVPLASARDASGADRPPRCAAEAPPSASEGRSEGALLGLAVAPPASSS